MNKSFGRERFLFVLALAAVVLAVFFADYRRSEFFDEEAGFGTYLTHTVRTWGEDALPQDTQGNKVAFVIDGDTFELASGERVRLIGIDTPESGGPGFSDARSALEQLILDADIRLESDLTDKDKYGRLLRYVWAGEKFVNTEMVRQGWARSYTYPPDVKYQEVIIAAQREAQNLGKGLWGTSVSQSGPIAVVDFHPNAAGNDNNNLNDEYVVLKNISGKKINLTGWKVEDESGNEYLFSTFTFNTGATITLYTGAGEQTPLKIYWGKTEKAVWNNSGDTLHLFNEKGEQVLEYRY